MASKWCNAGTPTGAGNNGTFKSIKFYKRPAAGFTFAQEITFMTNEKNKPSYILSVLGNKCPRCREGYIFQSKNPYALKHHRFMKMHEKCPVCGQVTDIEVGFYYGTSYVSYALTVAFSVATFIVWWLLIGISINDNRIFWWLGVNTFLMVVLQPVFMRLSRTLWLSWFVKYDPEWEYHQAEQPERIIKEQMGNW